jgi:uncharacterized membrane protein YdjX (TVP38/TMEM64 family)
MQKRALILSLLLLAASATLVLLSDTLTFAELKAKRDALTAFAAAAPLITALAYVFIFIICATLALPTGAILTIAAGLMFGLLPGIALSSFAATLGALCAFFTARHLLRSAIEARFGAVLTNVNRGLARDGAAYLFMLRLTVIFPYFVTNPVMGVTRMRWQTFAGVTMVAMIVNTSVWVHAGTQLARIESPGDVFTWQIALALALLGALPLLLRLRLQRFRKAHG